MCPARLSHHRTPGGGGSKKVLLSINSLRIRIKGNVWQGECKLVEQKHFQSGVRFIHIWLH